MISQNLVDICNALKTIRSSKRYAPLLQALPKPHWRNYFPSCKRHRTVLVELSRLAPEERDCISSLTLCASWVVMLDDTMQQLGLVATNLDRISTCRDFGRLWEHTTVLKLRIFQYQHLGSRRWDGRQREKSHSEAVRRSRKNVVCRWRHDHT